MSTVYAGPGQQARHGAVVSVTAVQLCEPFGSLRVAARSGYFSLSQRSFSAKHFKCRIQQASEKFGGPSINMPDFK